MSKAARPLKHAWTVVDGLRIHARVSDHTALPSAPAIVMLHGLLVSSRYMMPTAALLAQSYRVFAPDLPGYGKSAKPDHTMTVADYAFFLQHWMSAMDLPSAVLLANSFGCQVVAELAASFPSTAQRLVLVGPTIDPMAHSAIQQTARLLQDVVHEPPLYLAVLLRDAIDLGLRPALRVARAALEDHIETKLARIATPTLIVRGQYDPLVPQAWAEAATRLMPHARLCVVSGSGHVVNYNAPQALSTIIHAFLDES